MMSARGKDGKRKVAWRQLRAKALAM